MKILASDFDETIYFEDDEEKNKRNAKKINEFITRGNIFCIITGRNYSDIKLLLNKYNILYSYLICEDGAKIFNNVDYAIDTTYLEKHIIEKIVPILEKNNWDYYLDDGYNKTTNLNDCVKVVINCTDENTKENIVKTIKQNVKIHIYASRYHVNIINQNVNKANALKKLFNIENLDYKFLSVIGDNDNDYEMLKEFTGAVIKKHHHKLDKLKKDEFLELNQYIDTLI